MKNNKVLRRLKLYRFIIKNDNQVKQEFKYPKISEKPKIYVRGDIRLSNGWYRDNKEKDEYIKKSLERKLP